VQLPSAVACRVQTKSRRAALDFDILDEPSGMVGAPFSRVPRAPLFEPICPPVGAFWHSILLEESYIFSRAKSKAHRRSSSQDFDPSRVAPQMLGPFGADCSTLGVCHWRLAISRPNCVIDATRKGQLKSRAVPSVFPMQAYRIGAGHPHAC
jgi:hypothetical protein